MPRRLGRNLRHRQTQIAQSIGAILATANFRAPLRTSLVPTRGTGAPTYARATAGTVEDHEGVVLTCLAGEARFTGARRVRNLLTNTATPVTQNVATTSGVGAVSVSGTGSCFITGASAGVILPSGPVYTNNVNRAWLCDATAETVTGANLLAGDDSTFTSGVGNWTAIKSASIACISSQLEVINGAADFGGATLALTGFTVGKTYTLSIGFDRQSSASTVYLSVGSTAIAGAYDLGQVSSTNATGTLQLSFVATAAVYISVQINPTNGVYAYFDNASVRLAEPDRSIKSKPLPIYGSLTKTLVGGVSMYSGFSASDYLEEAYSPDLDLGTGDGLLFMGWVNQSSSQVSNLYHRSLTGQTGGILIQIGANGVVYLFATASTTFTLITTSAVGAFPVATPSLLTVFRSSGVIYVYANDYLISSVANTANLSYTNAVTRVGLRNDVANQFYGSLALVRIGGTAPSAGQIAQIYRDELALFQTPTGNRKQVTIPLGAGTTKLTFVGSNSDAQVEDVTAQSVQTAGEYVSVGVLSFPYHGTGVDGVKCFDKTLAGVPIPAATLKGYLAEGARTNLCLQSQTFDNASWGPSGSVVTANQGAAPDGTTTADLWDGAGFFEQAISVLNATTYTTSLYVKQGTGTTITIQARSAVPSIYSSVGITFTAGIPTITSSTGTATLASVGNGWYRISCAGATVDTTSSFRVRNGNGTFLLWGAQLEAAAFASSYIPTTTAAVTRNADVLTYPDTGNISDTAGTSYVEFSAQGITGSNQQILARDTNGRFPYVNSFTDRTQLYDGTTQNNATAGASFINATQKSAQSWGAGTKSISYAGTAIASSAYDGTQGTGAIAIGCNNAGTEQLGGNIDDVCIWTRTLPDAILKRISKCSML